MRRKGDMVSGLENADCAVCQISVDTRNNEAIPAEASLQYRSIRSIRTVPKNEDCFIDEGNFWSGLSIFLSFPSALSRLGWGLLRLPASHGPSIT
jgi:hypothetical protein